MSMTKMQIDIHSEPSLRFPIHKYKQYNYFSSIITQYNIILVFCNLVGPINFTTIGEKAYLKIKCLWPKYLGPDNYLGLDSPIVGEIRDTNRHTDGAGNPIYYLLQDAPKAVIKSPSASHPHKNVHQ